MVQCCDRTVPVPKLHHWRFCVCVCHLPAKLHEFRIYKRFACKLCYCFTLPLVTALPETVKLFASLRAASSLLSSHMHWMYGGECIHTRMRESVPFGSAGNIFDAPKKIKWKLLNSSFLAREPQYKIAWGWFTATIHVRFVNAKLDFVQTFTLTANLHRIDALTIHSNNCGFLRCKTNYIGEREREKADRQCELNPSCIGSERWARVANFANYVNLRGIDGQISCVPYRAYNEMHKFHENLCIHECCAERWAVRGTFTLPEVQTVKREKAAKKQYTAKHMYSFDGMRCAPHQIDHYTRFRDIFELA